MQVYTNPALFFKDPLKNRLKDFSLRNVCAGENVPLGLGPQMPKTAGLYLASIESY